MTAVGVACEHCSGHLQLNEILRKTASNRPHNKKSKAERDHKPTAKYITELRDDNKEIYKSR